MRDEIELLKKRFIELSGKSDRGGYFTFTDFLGLAEQSALESVRRDLRTSYSTFGGVEGAERIIARFGNPNEIGYEAEYPIAMLKIEPKDAKFGENLTHRDYLGALINLGIEREVLGDIIIKEKTAYLFAIDDMAEYIATSLVTVRHTDVRVTRADVLPEGALYKTEEVRVTVESLRLDAVIARIFHLSREDAQSLFRKKLVFADGRQIESTSYRPREGERISVRGMGRLIYKQSLGETKRGRLALLVEVYK